MLNNPRHDLHSILEKNVQHQDDHLSSPAGHYYPKAINYPPSNIIEEILILTKNHIKNYKNLHYLVNGPFLDFEFRLWEGRLLIISLYC